MLRHYFVFFLLVVGHSNASIFVHPDTLQCKLSGTSLKCDFDFIQDNVVIDNIPDSTRISTIYIYNARKVVISRVVCADLSFYTVNVIYFATNNVCQKKLMNLRLVDSSANQVPRQLSRLELTRSQVTKVVCDYGLQRLQVTDSQIEVFDAPWPVAGTLTMKIENSAIETFKSLNIENKVFLSIMNSTLKAMARESLTLGKGSVSSILNSFIEGEENSIVLKTGARLSIKGTEGKISIMGTQPGKEEEFNKRPPGVPQVIMTPPPDDADEIPRDPLVKEVTCKNDSITWIWFLPTVLATIETIVIIVQCGNKMPKKRKTSLLPDSENLSSVNTYGVQGQPNYPYQNSSLSFYNESGASYAPTTTLKRR